MVSAIQKVPIGAHLAANQIDVDSEQSFASVNFQGFLLLLLLPS